MRRTGVTAALVAATALALAGAGSAGVELVQEKLTIEVAGSVEDGCAEPILLTSGQVVESVQEFVDPSGRTHYVLRFHTFGVEGVGLFSGAAYRDQSHGTSTGVFSEDGYATVSFNVHARISSTDEDAVELVFRQTFHIVKRDGVNRVLLDRMTVSCA